MADGQKWTKKEAADEYRRLDRQRYGRATDDDWIIGDVTRRGATLPSGKQDEGRLAQQQEAMRQALSDYTGPTGWGGSLKTGAKGFASGVLLGVPELIAGREIPFTGGRKIPEMYTPEELEEHGTARLVGDIGGNIASSFWGPGKLALKAATGIGTGVLKRLAPSAAVGALQGVAMERARQHTEQQAGGTTFEEDPWAKIKGMALSGVGMAAANTIPMGRQAYAIKNASRLGIPWTRFTKAITPEFKQQALSSAISGAAGGTGMTLAESQADRRPIDPESLLENVAAQSTAGVGFHSLFHGLGLGAEKTGLAEKAKGVFGKAKETAASTAGKTKEEIAAAVGAKMGVPGELPTTKPPIARTPLGSSPGHALMTDTARKTRGLWQAWQKLKIEADKQGRNLGSQSNILFGRNLPGQANPAYGRTQKILGKTVHVLGPKDAELELSPAEFLNEAQITNIGLHRPDLEGGPGKLDEFWIDDPHTAESFMRYPNGTIPVPVGPGGRTTGGEVIGYLPQTITRKNDEGRDIEDWTVKLLGRYGPDQDLRVRILTPEEIGNDKELKRAYVLGVKLQRQEAKNLAAEVARATKGKITRRELETFRADLSNNYDQVAAMGEMYRNLLDELKIVPAPKHQGTTRTGTPPGSGFSQTTGNPPSGGGGRSGQVERLTPEQLAAANAEVQRILAGEQGQGTPPPPGNGAPPPPPPPEVPPIEVPDEIARLRAAIAAAQNPDERQSLTQQLNAAIRQRDLEQQEEFKRNKKGP